MADYEAPYENEQKNENTDLHAYFMTQFNLELENKSRKADNFKYGNEVSFNFDVVDNWNDTTNADFLDSVIENNNVSDENIKDVLLDLDSLEYDASDAAVYKTKAKNTNKYKTNDYIDDESLIDELCREESDSRLTPDIFNDEYLSTLTEEKKILPSMETAFSKRFCNYNTQQNTGTIIQNLEYYSYPNNILQNLESETYVLPDTPTSCSEFSYDRSERKVSVCESIESDLQSASYYDGNSETLDEDELFVNLDDFGFHFEDESSVPDDKALRNCERKSEHQKHEDRHCQWESCFEKYPNQNTLVEHIERSHVNTYKGDEFSCLWQNCARNRRPFNARYKLLIHMRVHSGHKPNRCHHPGCGKAFSRLENLKIHMRSHTGERPYACPAPHCRKAFSNSSDRAKHQRTHFNARPYACGAPGCGKRYTDPSSLRKHVKSHPHVTSVPRTCIPPSRPFKRAQEQLVPSSPAKLATLRSIRDKLTVSRMQSV